MLLEFRRLLFRSGENANLYVGCSLIDSFILDEPFYEHLQAEGSKMYVAKGSIRENHFRERHISRNGVLRWCLSRTEERSVGKEC